MTNEDTARLVREFPDFDLATLPEIPEGFHCHAWHNDTCPVWYDVADGKDCGRVGIMMLAVDFSDHSLREFPAGPRFTLHMVQADDTSPEPILSSDEWTTIQSGLRLIGHIRHLGYAFHPDTHPREYENAYDMRLFTDEQCEQIVADMEAVGACEDIYEFGMAVWRGMGLMHDTV